MGVLLTASRPTGFNSREDLEQTLLRYVALYNHQLRQSALKSKTPMQTMKDWYHSHPHLFQKRPHDRPGCTFSNLQGIFAVPPSLDKDALRHFAQAISNL